MDERMTATTLGKNLGLSTQQIYRYARLAGVPPTAHPHGYLPAQADAIRAAVADVRARVQARTLAGEFGVQSATVAALARRLGISKPLRQQGYAPADARRIRAALLAAQQPRVAARALARQLGSSHQTVINHARALGIATDSGFTPAEAEAVRESLLPSQPRQRD